MGDLATISGELERLQANLKHDSRWGIEVSSAGFGKVEFRKGKWTQTLDIDVALSRLEAFPDGYGPKGTWRNLKNKKPCLSG